MRTLFQWLRCIAKKPFRGVFLCCCLLLQVVVINSLTIEIASLRDFVYGATEATLYDNWINRVVEGLARPDFNVYAPWDLQTNGFGNYIQADEQQRQNWGEVVNYFVSGLFSEAEIAISNYGFPYDIIEFNDIDTGRTYYMLRERLSMLYFDDNGEPDKPELHQHGSFDYGWGLYIFNPAAETPTIINVVHPKDDFIATPIAVQAFQMWDARYLMIAGAGREVLWNDYYPFYHNGLSLSDPSRRTNHVFNVAFKVFADEIRETFNRREFSVQIHSFDYTHAIPISIQLSATAHAYPQLPIRDLSGSYQDVVNATPYVVHPANTIGINSEVLVNNYYSVNYSQHGMYYQLGDSLIPISNFVNLPGVGGFPMSYPMTGWSEYDVYTPFFHIEMKELPPAYPRDLYHFKWFYGYDHQTGEWDPENFYTKAIAFYTPWLEAMAEVLPPMFELNDDLPPTMPGDLRVVSTGNTTVQLAWERSSAYDFYSYEILLATEPIVINPPNYSIRTRDDYPILASQAFETISVSGLLPETQYYFQIRAQDYSENYSALSNQTTRYTGMVSITNFVAHGRDGSVDISWLAQFQHNNQGFNIYRKESTEVHYTLIASWETDISLAGDDVTNLIYNYTDNSVSNDFIYYYKITTVDDDFIEYQYDVIATAVPREIYTLIFHNQAWSISDEVEFGSNLQATDGFDANYDIVKSNVPAGNFIWAMSYHSNWSSSLRNLHRDIYEYFDPAETFKTWTIRAMTDQFNQPFYLSLSDNFSLPGQKLYLYDQYDNSYYDLTTTTYSFYPEDHEFRYFTLIWGKITPEVIFIPLNLSFVQGNEQVTIQWSMSNQYLIESVDLFLESGNTTLFIANNLDPATTSYEWTVPDNVMLMDANLIIQANMQDDTSLVYYSPYKIGVVPSVIEFDYQSGWHLVANTIESPAVQGASIFGPYSHLYTYDNQEEDYDEVTLFSFGTGYWVFMPASFSTEIMGNIRRESYNINLSPGWNLIPNMFMTDFKLEDLRFIVEGQNQTYRQALQYHLINRVSVGLEDNGYVISDLIPAGGSVWIYVYSTDLTLRLIPYHQNSDFVEFPVSWKAAIEIDQYGYLKDQVIIGSAPTTDDSYNHLYDFPKPPTRPGSEFAFYLVPEEVNDPYLRLHSEFKRDLITGTQDSLIWDFQLYSGPDIQPLRIKLHRDGLPTDYRIALITDDLYVELSELEELMFIPSSELISGQIKVTNTGYSPVESAPEIPVLFSNYPNPFYPGVASQKSAVTNIAFSVDRNDLVMLEIYNIKGQRVITLLNEKKDAGKYIITWDGKDSRTRPVASGIYLYSLSIGNKIISTKKMLLLR